MNLVEPITSKAKTGIWGLDDILSGGFSRGHVFLVEGAAGTGKTTIALQFLMERARPSRVVLDSLSEIRLLAQSSLTTVMLLDDLTTELADKTVHSVAHGVLRLEELAPAYGAERRRARIIKYRGVKFRGGYHDATITTGGLNIFPRLVASEYRSSFVRARMSSGIAELDRLLGGGIEAGSSTLILGPAGTGKSLLAIVFIVAAIARGEKAALFVFDEELGLLFARMKGLGVDLEEM